MEYGPENNIFVLKMMMKSGLEKIILKFLHAQRRSFLSLNLQFDAKIPFLRSKKDFPKKALRMEEFQNNFF